MNKCGIYAIVNMKNGRRYVGQSVRMHTRIQNHLFSLMENSHPNKHLQSAFNLYGAECFVGEIIEYCSRDELQSKEQLWIDHYGFDNLYNLCPVAGSTAGLKRSYPSEETRRKISDGNRGKFVSLETRQKQSKALIGNQNAKGTKLSDETRKKMSNFKRKWWAERKTALK